MDRAAAVFVAVDHPEAAAAEHSDRNLVAHSGMSVAAPAEEVPVAAEAVQNPVAQNRPVFAVLGVAAAALEGFHMCCRFGRRTFD